MLLYLSNADNVKGSPNENFARELMELFTLGVGNYTEADVAAAARAWTGHNYDSSTGTSTCSARPGTTPATRRSSGRPRTGTAPTSSTRSSATTRRKRLIAARFITKKLWEFFAHPGAGANVVNELADVFIANNLEIKPLLRALLLRPEFYSVDGQAGPRAHTDRVRGRGDVPRRPDGAAARPARGGPSRWARSCSTRRTSPGGRRNGYWLNTSALSRPRQPRARASRSTLRKNGGFDASTRWRPTPPSTTSPNYFGITSMSTVTRNALIAAHQAEKNTTQRQRVVGADEPADDDDDLPRVPHGLTENDQCSTPTSPPRTRSTSCPHRSVDDGPTGPLGWSRRTFLQAVGMGVFGGAGRRLARRGLLRQRHPRGVGRHADRPDRRDPRRHRPLRRQRRPEHGVPYADPAYYSTALEHRDPRRIGAPARRHRRAAPRARRT